MVKNTYQRVIAANNHEPCCGSADSQSILVVSRQKKLEAERERQRKKEEKQRLKEERRKEREEKRRQKRIEKKQKEEEERMQLKIALEERRLLIAQRKLESLRLLSELFERVKVGQSFVYIKVENMCLLCHFTFLFPSSFLKYLKTIRLHRSLLENIFCTGPNDNLFVQLYVFLSPVVLAVF